MATLSAQLCTPEEQALSAQSNAPVYCLTRDESIALTVCIPLFFRASDFDHEEKFVAQSGPLSLFACLVTYALILVSPHTINITEHALNHSQRNIRYHARRNPKRWRLIKVPMDIYLVNF
jgi:hypothetical protein